MIGIQIIAILFALWMMYFSYLHYHRREFGRTEFVLWQILWLGLVAIVVFPHSAQFLLKAFSITRTFDLVVIVGMMVLFGVTFRNYIIVRRAEKKVADFTRDDALKSLVDRKE